MGKKTKDKILFKIGKALHNKFGLFQCRFISMIEKDEIIYCQWCNAPHKVEGYPNFDAKIKKL